MCPTSPPSVHPPFATIELLQEVTAVSLKGLTCLKLSQKLWAQLSALLPDCHNRGVIASANRKVRVQPTFSAMWKGHPEVTEPFFLSRSMP